LIVEGKGHVAGEGVFAPHMDHRIAMSALVMGLAADKPVKVDDTAFIATSFPDFIPMMRALGADFSSSSPLTDRRLRAKARSPSAWPPITAFATSTPGSSIARW